MRNIRIAFYIIYFIVGVLGVIIYPDKALIALGVVAMIAIPITVEFFIMKIPKLLEMIYYVFVLAAIGGGSLFDFYTIIPVYDLILHTTFGFVACYFALFLFVKNKIKMPISIKLTFCFLASMGLAALWEIYEFAGDVLFGLDSQKAIETGVVDTMEDMVVNALGALIFVIIYTVDYVKKSKLLTITELNLEVKKND